MLFGSILGNAQETELKTDSLKEVVVTSSRIDLPLKKIQEPFKLLLQKI